MKGHSRAVKIIAWVALGLRIGISGFTELGSDQKLHYEMGLAVYKGGTLPTTAVANVYTGTACPGIIVPLAFSVPLYLSGGHPIGVALFLALLSFLTAWLTFGLYRELFPKIPQTIIATVVLLSPWGVMFSPVWQPPLLPICGWMFLRGYTWALKRPKDLWGAALMTGAVMLAFQIHLSFAILAALWALSLPLLGTKKWNLKGWILGGALGSITILPYFFRHSAGAGAGLAENVMTGSAPIAQIVSNVFLRLASFPTGETTRFIGQGLGFAGALSFINTHVWLWPAFLVGLLGSVVSVGGAVGFYFRKNPFQDRVAGLVWLAPFVATALFLFSVKPPSAHTIWILWSFSFFPFFWFVEKIRLQKVAWAPAWTVVWMACALVYSAGFVLANFERSIFGQAEYITKIRKTELPR